MGLVNLRRRSTFGSASESWGKRGKTTGKPVAIPLLVVVTLLIILMLVITFTVVVLERMRRTRTFSGITRIAASRRKRGETTSKSVAIPTLVAVTLQIILMLIITFTVVVLERMRWTRAFSGIASRITASRRKRGKTTSKPVTIPLVVVVTLLIAFVFIVTFTVVIVVILVRMRRMRVFSRITTGGRQRGKTTGQPVSIPFLDSIGR